MDRKKQAGNIYLRIFLALVCALAISSALGALSSFIVRNVSIILMDGRRQQEEEEIHELVEAANALISVHDMAFQEVISENVYSRIDGYEVYISGIDGKIYYEGRQEGISVEDMDLSLKNMYIYSAEFADGNGYVIVQSGVDGRMSKTTRTIIRVGTSMLFLFLAWVLIRREIRKYEDGLQYSHDPELKVSEQEAVKQAPEQIQQEAVVEELQNEAKEEKEYTDMYVVLQQLIGELDFETCLEGQPGPVFITGNIELFVQSLYCMFGKIEAVKKPDTEVIIAVGADDMYAKLTFRAEVTEEAQHEQVLDEGDLHYIRERLRPVEGNLVQEIREDECVITLGFLR